MQARDMIDDHKVTIRWPAPIMHTHESSDMLKQHVMHDALCAVTPPGTSGVERGSIHHFIVVQHLLHAPRTPGRLHDERK